MRKNVDFLNGPIAKNITIFMLPVIFTTVINLAFNSVDLIVVGRLCGHHAIAAVGATSRIVSLLTCLFDGFASGFSIVLGHIIGEGKKEKISRAVHTIVPFAAILGIILTLIGLLASRSILEMMNTPSDIIDDAALYLKIFFSGSILRMMMTFIGATLRASGDSKTPMINIAIGGVLNVIFNLIFVKVFNMTVDGVAYGTVISEGTTAVLGLIALMHKKDDIKFRFKKVCLDKNVVTRTIKLGVPCGLQASMFSISTLVLSSAVNTLGSVTVAANAAALNIVGFIHAVTFGFSNAAVTFIGQNYGAKNMGRIKKALKILIISETAVVFLIGLLVNIFSKQLLGLYVTDSAEVIAIGQKKLLISAGLYFMSGIHDCISGAVKGMGDARSPLIIGIFAICLFKILWVYTVFQIPSCHNYMVITISYPISWVLDGIATAIVLNKKIKQKEKEFAMAKA